MSDKPTQSASDEHSQAGQEEISRRKWLLGISSATTAGFLAGCGGGGSANGGESPEGTPTPTAKEEELAQPQGTPEQTATPSPAQQQIVDQWFRLPANAAGTGFTAGSNNNMWNPTAGGFYSQFLFEPLTHFRPTSGDWWPILAKDWSISKNKLVIQLREGITWSYGKALNADDVVNHLMIDKAFETDRWQFAEDVQATGEYEITYTRKPANNVLAKNALLDGTIYTHPELHKPYIERAKDATTKSAKSKIQQDLTKLKIGFDEAKEAGISAGPVKLGKRGNRRMTLPRRSDYPVGWEEDSPGLNFKGVWTQHYGEEQGQHQAAIAGKIDAMAGGSPAKVKDQLVDNGWWIIPSPDYQSVCLFFSKDSMWGKNTEKSRKLRQALAYVYNPDEGRKAGDPRQALRPKYKVDGLVRPLSSRWLGDVFEKMGYTNYGNKKYNWERPDKAEQVLKEAGYTRNNNDKWVDSSGKPLTLKLSFPSNWSVPRAVAKNILNQFQQFGIKASPNGLPANQLFTKMENNHDFQVGMATYGAPPHPYNVFRPMLGTYDAGWNAIYSNLRKEYTVPWPPGDPSGTKTVDIEQRIKELPKNIPRDQQKKLVQEISWICNKWVYALTAFEPVELAYYHFSDDNSSWTHPKITEGQFKGFASQTKSAPEWFGEPTWSLQMRTGLMKAKPKQ